MVGVGDGGVELALCVRLIVCFSIELERAGHIADCDLDFLFGGRVGVGVLPARVSSIQRLPPGPGLYIRWSDGGHCAFGLIILPVKDYEFIGINLNKQAVVLTERGEELAVCLLDLLHRLDGRRRPAHLPGQGNAGAGCNLAADGLQGSFFPHLVSQTGPEGPVGRDRHCRNGPGPGPAGKAEIIEDKRPAVQLPVIPFPVPILHFDLCGHGIAGLRQPIIRPVAVPVVDLDVDAVRFALRRVGIGHSAFVPLHVGGDGGAVPGQLGFRFARPHAVILQAGKLTVGSGVGKGGV